MDVKISMTSVKSKSHKNNEDSYYVCDNYLIVADGMGGEGNGDIASKIAVDSISALLDYELKGTFSEEDIKDLSFEAIKFADSKITDYIIRNPSADGMGTTVLIAIKLDNVLHVSWCGDSHCYVYTNGHLESITNDHSYVQELIDSGQITEQESFTHPDNNIITRYVGGGDEWCVPDYQSYKMQESDILILCSDGLSGYCRTEDIEDSIIRNSNIDNLPGELSDLAIKCGSDDDTTILIVYNPLFKSRQSLIYKLKGMVNID